MCEGVVGRRSRVLLRFQQIVCVIYLVFGFLVLFSIYLLLSWFRISSFLFPVLLIFLVFFIGFVLSLMLSLSSILVHRHTHPTTLIRT